MQRNPFQDVVPPKMGQEVKRSIRDIPVMRRSRPVVQKELVKSSVFIKPETLKSEEAYEIPKPQIQPTNNSGYPPLSKSKKRLGSPKFFGGLAVIAVLAFVFFIMNAFTSAQVEIVPKTETANFNTAIKISDKATSTALLYQVIELSSEREKEVPASGEEQVEHKASAKIVVYNNFNSEPQRLIARTRFATPNGLIFRINDSITVPGKIGSEPGSIEVTVFADEAGDKYNIGLTDFTIPGFQDDPTRYKGFYARSITKAEGGFVGMAKKVSESDKNATKTELESLLKSDIEKNLSAQIDPSLVVLSGGIEYDFSEPTSQSAGNNAILKESVRAEALAFKRSDLSDLIKTQFLPEWQGLPAEITSYENMVISVEEDGVSAKISGSAEMAALVDVESVINRLAGKPKAELLNIINSSPSILSAKTAVRPIWKGAFPEDQSKISVIIVK